MSIFDMPVERRGNLVCWNADCSACDQMTYICTSGKKCRDHRAKPDLVRRKDFKNINLD